MQSWKKPTAEQVDRAVSLLARREHYRYFFDKLENPEWVEPLYEKGFFQNPPFPEADPERGVVRFPPWPDVCYLARMAAHKPDVVCKIILRMPATENITVLRELADAVLKMPPEVATRLVDKVKAWAGTPELDLLLSDKLGKLITHLAQGGYIRPAQELAQVLLDVLPDPGASGKTEAESDDEAFKLRLPPEPKAKIDLWHYKSIFEQHVPELVKAAKKEALALLCGLLDKAIVYSQLPEENDAEDYSYIWRGAIEHSAEDYGEDLKNILVDSVRDAAELLVREELLSLPEVVQYLESPKWPVFRRIALHVLRRFPDKASELVSARLTDRSLFDDRNLRYEFGVLLREQFNSLAPEQQQLILGWLEEGPDLSRVGPDAPPEERERIKKRWQLRWLAYIKEELPEDWKQRYENLVAELGKTEEPDFFSKTWVGPTSPKTAAELREMTVSEIVDFLKTWQPHEGFFEPSPEGLGRELTEVIEENPERFAVEAARFCGLDPTYVRHLLHGLEGALKKGKTFSWGPVLTLCKWVTEQAREIPGRDARSYSLMEVDPHCGWTRTEIARLFQAGFDKDSIPFALRKDVWFILRPITDDPDPTPEDEARYGPPNMDWATFSINTTRGEAMHTVISYALWVHRHLKNLSDGRQKIDRGFDEMPEVREILERHLDPVSDPSPTIRSVYGRWFPWLVLLDPKWTNEKISQILPMSKSQKAFFDAAWEAYVVFNDAYDQVFDVLREQYAFVVERVEYLHDDQRRHLNPARRFAEHLMIFYWRGKITSDDPLLTSFWEKAAPSLRYHALSFVGQSLYRTEGAVATAILERLEALWQSRLDFAKADPQNYGSEMRAFGWWFISEKFDEEWAISRLLEALGIQKETEPDDRVVERLSILAVRMPLECIRCLRALVEDDKEGWKIGFWREWVRSALANALQSGNEKAIIEAENLINYLGSRGYVEEFRDLLSGF